MSDTNSQCEAVLDSLTELCCASLQGDYSELEERSDALLKSLVMSGFARTSDKTLQAELQDRVLECCQDNVLHRGSELSGITKRLQHKYDEIVRWGTNFPHEDGMEQAKPANISSATDD